MQFEQEAVKQHVNLRGVHLHAAAVHPLQGQQQALCARTGEKSTRDQCVCVRFECAWVHLHIAAVHPFQGQQHTPN